MGQNSKLAMVLVSLSLMTSVAGAQNAESVLKDAETLWQSRDQIAKLDQIIDLVSRSGEDLKAGSNDIVAKIRLLSSRALLRKGGTFTQDKSEKLKIFESAMAEAKASTAAVDSADAKYFYAAALGRWAETKGVMASLGKKDELIENLTETKSRKALDGTAGESYEGHGADRVLGKIYSKLPSFVGGSRSKALDLLTKAHAQSPKFAMNAIYLAEVLADGTDAEIARACEALTQLVSNDPATLIPERSIETKEEFVQAEQIKSELCN